MYYVLVQLDIVVFIVTVPCISLLPATFCVLNPVQPKLTLAC